MDLDEPRLVACDAVAPVGVLLRLTVECNVFNNARPIIPAVRLVVGSLIDEERLAGCILHKDRSSHGNVEQRANVLIVIQQCICDHLAVIGVGSSTRRSETVGVTSISTHIRLPLLSDAARRKAGQVAARDDLCFHLIVFTNGISAQNLLVLADEWGGRDGRGGHADSERRQGSDQSKEFHGCAGIRDCGETVRGDEVVV